MKKIILCTCIVITLAGCMTNSATKDKPKMKEAVFTLITNGKSAYQIVIPDHSAPGVEAHLKMEATRFASILEEGYGVRLPVCKEKDLPIDTPAIYIGDTAFARAHGIEASKLPSWHALQKVVGENLILAGCDRPAAKRVSRYSYNYILSSCRAMTEFLKTYAGIRFLFPGDNGIHVPKGKILSVPCDLDTISPPPFLYCRTRPLPVFFETANGLLPSAATYLYGGHSYYSAVPAAKYSKTHPEYFQLKGNARTVYSGHLCISNKAVQELIYQEMLKKLDSGYEMVELAHTDAYSKCECKNCVNLFGTKDAAEQLWILHRNLAERLYRERPTKKVLIIAYNPTWSPPKTFSEFPPNTAIELCRYSPEVFAEWRKIKVPQGFSVYLYNWGNYEGTGLSPSRTFEYLEQQMKLLKANNVRSLFLCGFPSMYGLEAPMLYAFFRMMENPNMTSLAAADEFYRSAFQEAEKPMRTFYRTINNALYVNPSNLAFKVKVNASSLIPYLWNPAILGTLERELSTAEKMAYTQKVKARLALVRADFDFVKTTARALAFYQAYRLNPNWSNFNQLEKAVLERRVLIDLAFPQKSNATSVSLPGWKDIKRFGYSTRAETVQNGTLHGLIGAPFNWDFKLLREKKILPCKDIMRLIVKRAEEVPTISDFNSGVWAKAEWNDMDGIQLGRPSVPTRFKVMYDDRNLYIAFDGARKKLRNYRALGKDGACWGQDCLEILLDPYGLREKHYHFMFNPIPDSFYDSRVGFNTDILDPNIHKPDPTWNGNWSYVSRLDENRWQALVTIPFSDMQTAAPRKGTIWTANFGREEYHDGIHSPELLLWSPNPETRDFHDRDKFGELLFD